MSETLSFETRASEIERPDARQKRHCGMAEWFEEWGPGWGTDVCALNKGNHVSK